MSKKEDDATYTMQKVAKTWTSKRLYEISENGKVVLKLKDEEDAKSVVEYLNKKYGDCGKKGSKETTAKKSKKSASKKSTTKSTKKSTAKKSSAKK